LLESERKGTEPTGQTENPKSIAILGTRGIPASYGGFETFAEQLGIRLVERGIDVTVFCEQKSSQAAKTYKGIQLAHIYAPQLGTLRTLLFDLKCLWRARKNHDVVYMLGYPPAIFCWIPRLWGTQVWINMDGLEWKRSKWNAAGKAWMKLASLFARWTANLLVFDSTAGALAELGKAHDKTKHVVIEYGADIPSEEPDPKALREFSLLSGQYHLVVARVEPENHVAEIISAANNAEIKYPLVVVGDTQSRSPYAARCREVAGPNTKLIGSVYDQEKLSSLRYHCKSYIHGHSVGGTNPSLLEAMACGNIAIAHGNPFNKEVLNNGGFCFLNGDELAKALVHVEAMSLKDGEALKSQARARVSAYYTWDRISDVYAQLIRQDIGSPPTSAS